jgi:NAD(P)-dependent dehydrogenase (short-subunit alcohol dehydrogenase family)
MVDAGQTEGFLKRVPTRAAVAAGEVARLVAELGEPAYRPVTGVVIPIDGGLTVPI